MDKLLLNTTAASTILQRITDTTGTMIASLSLYFAGLNNKDRSTAHTINAGRENAAGLISKITPRHTDSTAVGNDLASRLVFDDVLETLRQNLVLISEMITDTQNANAADIIKFAARLQAAACKANSASNETPQPAIQTAFNLDTGD